MDDTCAVCAEALQWVAYGPCGHREVCSTCVARLRFICEDPRCCICKTESPSVFVTKALGDYTSMIDFSRLPSHPKEGRIASFWYHEDTNAFFDDFDHYKIIKATCRLSCGVCDKADEVPPPGASSGPRRSTVFKSIEQLKGHMFHKHRLVMCSLCLESRKVFICEQKLYTKAQLKQHISAGDSVVDGDENERGGFAGHPVCEFCKTPFYGENELYTHMSREHYTCHMCQRQHPGQYEYFRNYDDLEMHFRHQHFLCEDEACLGKKFVVFLSEGEMKRHNTLEHGGKMSRSKRSAAMQIPTSFRFRRTHEQESRRGRGRDNQLSAAIEASLADIPPPAPEVIDPGVLPVESLNGNVTEPKYLHALGNTSANGHFGDSSFPPLPVTTNKKISKASNAWASKGKNNGASSSSRSASRSALPASDTEATSSGYPELPSSTMKKISNPSTTWGTRGKDSGASVSYEAVSGSSGTISATESVSAGYPELSSSRNKKITNASSAWGNRGKGNGVSGSYRPVSETETTSSGFPELSSRKNDIAIGKMLHSASAPNLAVPVMENMRSEEEVQTANRSLVEKLRHAMKSEEKFHFFKRISAQYREGEISTSKYLDHVEEFGLVDLVLDLALLLPESPKQNELVNAYRERSESKNNRMREANKAKGKKAEKVCSKDRLAEDVMSTVRSLQSRMKLEDNDVEILSKEGYRSSKNDEVAGSSSGRRNGKKKPSKFHRMRLGDGSIAALLDGAGLKENPSDRNGEEENEGLAVRGVWRKGGAQKLF